MLSEFRAMNIHGIPHGFARQIARFRQDQQGTSAVELAMILPVLLTFYLGTVEVSQGVSLDRKVTLTARTAADLASQVSSIDNTYMGNLLNASSSVMSCTTINQCDINKLKITVSEVKIDANQTVKVVWSDTFNGTKRAVGSSVSLPTALKIANTNLILSEVAYSYTPTVGHVITGTLNLSDQIYMRPRLSECITRNTGSSQTC
jgi:Flp pilus assembly protein TadG